MQPIDSALATGPVLLEFYTTGCEFCQQQKPILDQLKTEYPSVTVLEVNAVDNAELAQAFAINVVPQMSVIANKNPDGSYVYVGSGGTVSGDRLGSKFVGFTDKSTLVTAIEAALSAAR
jgi:thiol-disulfide isomerase/thioredoxin